MSRARSTSAADRAHDAIRGAIKGGRLIPGAMLSENELAASLAMSRTPIRAALARLQDEGWVTIYPQRGALVRSLSDVEVREAAEIRHALETAGVRVAAAVDRDALATRLAPSLAAQETALRDDDLASFTDVAAHFHREFVLLARNATMVAMYDRIQDRQVLSIVGSAHTITSAPDHVMREHRALLDHAVAGDWFAFGGELAAHQTRSHSLERLAGSR